MHARFTTEDGRGTYARPEASRSTEDGRQFVWMRRDDDGEIVKAYLHGEE